MELFQRSSETDILHLQEMQQCATRLLAQVWNRCKSAAISIIF